jgi:hypothetical protein
MTGAGQRVAIITEGSRGIGAERRPLTRHPARDPAARPIADTVAPRHGTHELADDLPVMSSSHPPRWPQPAVQGADGQDVPVVLLAPQRLQPRLPRQLRRVPCPIEYNCRGKAELEAAGVPVEEWDQPFDLHAISVFLRDGDRVFHTYLSVRSSPWQSLPPVGVQRHGQITFKRSWKPLRRPLQGG